MPLSRCRAASSHATAQNSVLPRLISASARRSSPRPGCAASAASAMACSRARSSATAGRFPRWRASSSRTTPSSSRSWSRLAAGTAPDRRSARARYRSAASSDPCASSSAAATTASSASAARQAGGEPGQQLMHGGGLPVQVQAGPVVGEQPGGQVPVAGRLGVADRLHREPLGGEPARRRRRAARSPRPARRGAVPAAAGRRTSGGSGTRTAPCPATPRTRLPPPGPAGPAPRPRPRSAGPPAPR